MEWKDNVICYLVWMTGKIHSFCNDWKSTINHPLIYRKYCLLRHKPASLVDDAINKIKFGVKDNLPIIRPLWTYKQNVMSLFMIYFQHRVPVIQECTVKLFYNVCNVQTLIVMDHSKFEEKKLLVNYGLGSWSCNSSGMIKFRLNFRANILEAWNI